MIRVKRGNVARKSRKKVLGLAKGYVGSHSRLFRIAKNVTIIKRDVTSFITIKTEK